MESRELVVVKSTVPVRDRRQGAQQAGGNARRAEPEGPDFREDLGLGIPKEGSAVNDCMEPERIIIGVRREKDEAVCTGRILAGQAGIAGSFLTNYRGIVGGSESTMRI